MAPSPHGPPRALSSLAEPTTGPVSVEGDPENGVEQRGQTLPRGEDAPGRRIDQVFRVAERSVAASPLEEHRASESRGLGAVHVARQISEVHRLRRSHAERLEGFPEDLRHGFHPRELLAEGPCMDEPAEVEPVEEGTHAPTRLPHEVRDDRGSVTLLDEPEELISCARDRLEGLRCHEFLDRPHPALRAWLPRRAFGCDPGDLGDGRAAVLAFHCHREGVLGRLLRPHRGPAPLPRGRRGAPEDPGEGSSLQLEVPVLIGWGELDQRMPQIEGDRPHGAIRSTVGGNMTLPDPSSLVREESHRPVPVSTRPGESAPRIPSQTVHGAGIRRKAFFTVGAPPPGGNRTSTAADLPNAPNSSEYQVTTYPAISSLRTYPK